MEHPSDLPSWISDSHRSDMLQWVEVIENSPVVRIPPVSIIWYRDLLGRAWGWNRLLANLHGTFDWHEYKRYVGEYMQSNATKVAAGKDALHVAAKQCIETEKRLIRSSLRHLSLEALSLSSQIQNRAGDLIQSDGEYPVAAAALLCITNEAEFMYMLATINYRVSEVFTLSTKIRRSALNLMLYTGSESAVAAGAMVGIATEVQTFLESLNRGTTAFTHYFGCHKIRRTIAAALTRLEQELACNAGSDTTEKSIGSDGGPDSEGSDSIGNSRKKMDGQDSEEENDKMNKNLNNQTDSAEVVREVNKEVKASGEETLKGFENGTKGEAGLNSAEGVREDNKEVEAAGEETLKGFENGTAGEAGLTVAKGREKWESLCGLR